MSPPKPLRPGSHSAIEVVAPGAFNEYREPSFGERPTVPPITPDAVPRALPVPRKPTQRGSPAPQREARPQPTNAPPTESMPPPPSFRHEDGPPNAQPREAPARAKIDSVEVATGTLLDELAEKGEQARQAEARATAAERELARLRAPKDSIRARGPTISLGDAKWWFVVITALLGSGGLSALIVKWHELDRPTASQAQVTDVKQDVQESAEQAKKRATDEKSEREAADQRARVAAAFLCAQGLRADGLDCDALLQEIEFAPQPLHPRGPLLWKTRARWPQIRDPPNK